MIRIGSMVKPEYACYIKQQWEDVNSVRERSIHREYKNWLKRNGKESETMSLLLQNTYTHFHMYTISYTHVKTRQALIKNTKERMMKTNF